MYSDVSSVKMSSSSSSTYIASKDDQINRITELRSKNQQCIEYILRTERLLALIRTEQDRIALEIDSITSGRKDTPQSVVDTTDYAVADTDTTEYTVTENDINDSYSSDSDSDNNSSRDSSSDVDEYMIDSPVTSNHGGFTLQSLVDHIQHEYVLV